MAVPSAAKLLAMGGAGLTSEEVEKGRIEFCFFQINPDLDQGGAHERISEAKVHFGVKSCWKSHLELV